MKNTKLKQFLSLTLMSILFISCGQKQKKDNRFVIWTSCAEFAQYVELFNSTHPNSHAILIYKENPALSLPPPKDETQPDLIIGPWLRSDDTSQYFKPLDYLFERKHISSNNFYEQLLKAGKVKRTQYLIPVSFNLPTIIFSQDNSNLVQEKYTLNLEQIRKTASDFNNQKRNGQFNKMGFSILSNPDFLYLVSKMYNSDFHEKHNKITWNKNNLSEAIDYLSDWITTENKSAQDELDFSFKYLSMPYYRQVIKGNTLFSYTTSDQLFTILREQEIEIDYRWISNENSILTEDNIIMMGIYKKADNQIGASEFISWFFNPENQKTILDRKIKLNLNTEVFGLAGGFSSLQQVTEKILPTYYTKILSNLPPASQISVSNKVPAKWQSYKTLVIEPYIKEKLINPENSSNLTIDDLEKEWRKKVFE